MYVCVYVICMYVCMQVCMYVCMYLLCSENALLIAITAALFLLYPSLNVALAFFYREIATNVSTLHLPYCCGLAWIFQNPQIEGMAYTTCIDNNGQVVPLSPVSASCPCKALVHNKTKVCAGLTNWTINDGVCSNEGCPPGTRLFPLDASVVTCVDPDYRFDQFTFFETACEGVN